MMSRKVVDNERRACDAIARALESLAGTARANPYSPEDEGLDPPIEYVFDLGKQTYAMEHTVVEAFEGQIDSNVDFDKFVTPITNALDGCLPRPGFYTVAFAIHPTKDMKAKAIAALQRELIAWIASAADELHAEFPEAQPKERSIRGHRNSRSTSIGGVDVVLSREVGWFVSERAEGRLRPTRFAPRNYESLRVDRVRTAMERKLPKLQKWKDQGARSALVLENRDMALSNHVVILEAAEKVLSGRADVPDEIWLVDTTIENEWTAICLMRDGVSFPDDESNARYYDYDPSTLNSV
jgi:hypothetical protein